jgi:hypothetical protein
MEKHEILPGKKKKPFHLKIEKLSKIICKLTGNYLPSSEAIAVSMLVSCLLEDEAVPERPLSCSLEAKGVTERPLSCLLEAKAVPERPLRIKKAGFLGTGKFAVSLLSIKTTFEMVGRSDGSSCTHKSAAFTHLRNSLVLQLSRNVSSIKSNALSSLHNLQAWNFEV